MFKTSFKRAKRPQKSAIIIGAGAAGLTCAQSLLQSEQFSSITILEAGTEHGGRVRKLTGFTDFPIEKGGEELHMSSTPYYSFVAASDAGIFNQHELACKVQDPYTHELIDQSLFEQNYHDDTHKVFEELAEFCQSATNDLTVEQYIRQRKPENFKPEMNFFLEAHIATEHGTTLDQMGSQATGLYQTYQPHFTEGFILTKKSHFDVLQETFKAVLPLVEYQSPVTMIDYSRQDGRVAVTVTPYGDQKKNSGKKNNQINENTNKINTSTTNQSEVMEADDVKSPYIIEADYVVCTVPISQLKKGAIKFEPALPLSSQAALTKIDMDYMGKYFLQFKERFWQQDLLWLTTEKAGISWASSTGRSQKDNTITFHIAGQRAREMSSPEGLKKHTAIMLEALSEIFKVDATSMLIDSYYMDWSQEPFIQGGYSYPALNQGCAREALFQSIDNKLFFAGEACSQQHYATIHGAVETGISAAEEILARASIQPRL